MMNKIVNRVSEETIRNGIVSDEDLPVFKYGLTYLIEISLVLFTMISVAAVMDCMVEAVVFLCAVSLFRSFGGGYHAGSFRTCYWISLFIYMAGLAVTKWLPVGLHDVLHVVCCIGSACIAYKVPLLECETRRLDQAEHRMFLKIHYSLNAAYPIGVLTVLMLGIREEAVLAFSLGVLVSQLSRLYQYKGA